MIEHDGCIIVPIVGAVGAELNVIVTFDAEGGQGGLEIVQVNTYMPAPPAGVKVVFLADVLPNCDNEVLGPLETDQAPMPTEGLFAERFALTLLQID